MPTEAEKTVALGNLKIGDTIRVFRPPAPTRWELLLWRLFRIEIKRKPQWQTYVVNGRYYSDAHPQAPD